MALALAALPAHVRLRCRQARQPRSLVAEPHRALLPLRDAAAADADRLVYVPAPVSVPQGVDGVGLRRRACCAVPDLRAAASAVRGRRPAGWITVAHRADGELRLFQSAHGG